MAKGKNKCEICGKISFVNRRPNHHIIPRKNSGVGNKVWLCSECHIMLHIADDKGLCSLPKKQSKSILIGKNSRTKLLMDKIIYESPKGNSKK